MKQISIIGGGAWGKALASTFAPKFKVTMHMLPHDGKMLDERVETVHDFNHIASPHVFLVVPAAAVRDVCGKLQNVLNENHIIIICSKGIEVSSGKLMSELIHEFLPQTKLAMLAGPNFASEISRGLPALTSIVSDDLSLSEELSATFNAPNFGLVPSANLLMAEIFSSLKNVLALLCGVTRGLALGENFTASLVSAGAKEMLEFARDRGQASEEMLFEPVGIGDIFLTCAGQESRNNRFGSELVSKYLGQSYQEIPMTTTVEGLSTILAIQNWKFHAPILSTLSYELITGKYKTKEELADRFVKSVFRAGAE